MDYSVAQKLAHLKSYFQKPGQDVKARYTSNIIRSFKSSWPKLKEFQQTIEDNFELSYSVIELETPYWVAQLFRPLSKYLGVIFIKTDYLRPNTIEPIKTYRVYGHKNKVLLAKHICEWLVYSLELLVDNEAKRLTKLNKRKRERARLQGLNKPKLVDARKKARRLRERTIDKIEAFVDSTGTRKNFSDSIIKEQNYVYLHVIKLNPKWGIRNPLGRYY